MANSHHFSQYYLSLVHVSRGETTSLASVWSEFVVVGTAGSSRHTLSEVRRMGPSCTRRLAQARPARHTQLKHVAVMRQAIA